MLQLYVLLKDRKLNRLAGFDYSKNGWYFVTICTKYKGNVLGEITDKFMELNELGKIVKDQWLWLENRFDYLKYDEWIIMPDHIHGIMVIDNYIVGNGRDGDEIIVGNGRDGNEIVGNGRDRSVQENKIKSISELVGAFKTTSSKNIHNLGYPNFQWHKSFYDEIIRDEKSLERIRKYIIENPDNFLKSKL